MNLTVRMESTTLSLQFVFVYEFQILFPIGTLNDFLQIVNFGNK